MFSYYRGFSSNFMASQLVWVLRRELQWKYQVDIMENIGWPYISLKSKKKKKNISFIEESL